MERDANAITSSTGGIIDFNSHAHVERDSIIPFIGFSPINFNSHAHVERDPTTPFCVTAVSISTHTLTWSVTLKQLKVLKNL